ncbi:helix-turn-helix domain-containing protein, partial [Rhizobium sp. CF142]|uniref:helix-turn-helix domain-containing protein n=1 Tax=Rhizobium sp. CF142 TaxID=1144314 RepID=UPI001FCB3B14
MRKLRVARGLSQERLALEATPERVSISQIKRKQINLGIDSLGKIASVLECRVCEPLTEPAEGEEPPANLRPGSSRLTRSSNWQPTTSSRQ